MSLQIEILSGPLKGKRMKLPAGIHMVGRGLGPLPFQDLGLSQEHAKLHVFTHRIEVEDVGSTNGTYVNGARVARQVLKEGDEVRLGPESAFRVGGDEKGATRRLPTEAQAPSGAEGIAVSAATTPPKFPAHHSGSPTLQAPRKEQGKAWIRAAFIAALAVGGLLLAYGLQALFSP